MFKSNSIEAVIATIWHPKNDVDSYHVVSILHDGNQLDSEIIYGYGNQYMETAKTMINNFCMMNDDEIIENLDFSDVHVVKVKRKRDLFQNHQVVIGGVRSTIHHQRYAIDPFFAK